MNVGYADDVSMSRTILVRQANEDNTLKDETSHLDSWANTNNMLLNGKKSQMLRICLCRSVPSPPRLILGTDMSSLLDIARNRSVRWSGFNGEIYESSAELAGVTCPNYPPFSQGARMPL
ncbi:hypothetical protein Bbelb_341220 [Branchiostoma belcheri]|nr:hypothetical protein Bbelb_341220 [Branchiostoma belcheri]